MMLPALRALVLAIWSALGVQSRDAEQLADVAALVVLEDADNAPVFGSHAEDLAVEAVYLAEESGAHLRPRPMSWDAIAGVSCGAWQAPCFVVRSHDLLYQGRYWLMLLRRGQIVCPASPLAPVMGGCTAARRSADRRVALARSLLSRTLEGGTLAGAGEVDASESSVELARGAIIDTRGLLLGGP
jgi:hypothetical protein